MGLLLDLIATHPALTGLILFAGPIFGWEFWQGSIRPRLMRRVVVTRLADELVAKYGDRADEMALTFAHRGWYDSDSFEQGKWRRVRKELQRRGR